MSRPGAPYAITPHLLLRAYSIGLFPMAESAEDDQLFWVDPEKRAIFPLDPFIVSRSLAKTVRSDRFDVSVDQDFDAVIDACAAPAPDREKTWINAEVHPEGYDMIVTQFAAKYGKVPILPPGYTKTTEIMQPAWDKIRVGEATAEEAIPPAVAEANKVLAEEATVS